MIRLLFGHKRSDRINMQKLREKMGILSVNQLACYHILLETFNILNKNSSPQIEEKIKPKGKSHYHTRSSERKDLNVMNKPKKNCIGFTYISAKLWNMLPVQIRDQKSPDPFKAAIKSWIPSNIPDWSLFLNVVSVMCLIFNNSLFVRWQWYLQHSNYYQFP